MLTTKLFLASTIAILAHSGDYMRPNIKATESKIRMGHQPLVRIFAHDGLGSWVSYPQAGVSPGRT